MTVSFNVFNVKLLEEDNKNHEVKIKQKSLYIEINFRFFNKKYPLFFYRFSFQIRKWKPKFPLRLYKQNFRWILRKKIDNPEFSQKQTAKNNYVAFVQQPRKLGTIWIRRAHEKEKNK